MNDPKDFPELHFGSLSDLAKDWAENYSVIQKVTLYQGKREGSEGYRSTKYVLVVKVPEFKVLEMRSLPFTQPTSEKMYLTTPSQYFFQENMRFLKWSFGGESCWHIHDELANAYMGEPPGSYELEWRWYPMSSEDDIPTEWIIPSRHWILLALSEGQRVGAQKEVTATTSIADGLSKESDVPILKFYRVGDYWVVGNEKEEVTIKHLKGLSCIHFLLKYRDQEIPSAQLYSSAKSPHLEGEISDYRIDPEARTSIRNKVEQLQEERKSLEPNSFDDPLMYLERKEEIEDEISKLNTYLKDSRTSFEPGEGKARKNVQKAIRRALGKIHNQCPTMKSFLNDGTIKTGRGCVYTPYSDQKVHWIFDPPKATE